MARQRKPSSLKQGKSENKEQLAEREAIERQLMGNSDNVSSIPEYLSDEEKIYYEWLINELEICGIITNLDKLNVNHPSPFRHNRHLLQVLLS